MNEESLVTAKKAAPAVGMGASSLYRLAKSGRVPCYRVGPRAGGVRFNIRELREALRQPANAEAAAGGAGH